MLDAEKHKNAGANMETVNDGSLLDSLPERDTLTEAEKVADGYDLGSVEIKEQDFINAVNSVTQKEQDKGMEM